MPRASLVLLLAAAPALAAAPRPVALVPVLRAFLSPTGADAAAPTLTQALSRLQPENREKMRLLVDQGAGELAAAGAPVAAPPAPAAPAAEPALDVARHYDAVLSGFSLDELRDPERLGAAVSRLWDGADPAAPAESRALARARVALAPLFAGGAHLRLAPAKSGAEARDEAVRRAAAFRDGGVVSLEAPTAAGKSTFAAELRATLGPRLKIFPMDLYFKSKAEMPLGADGQTDFDQPGSLHLDRAARDIRALLAGREVELPAYDWVKVESRERGGPRMRLEPGDVLLVDSIYASHPDVLEAGEGRSSLNVFIHAPAVVRLLRRLRRDRVERGLPMARNLGLWGNILHDERTYVLPYLSKAELVLDSYSEEELRGLQEEYAKLLASEPALLEPLSRRIGESLAADLAGLAGRRRAELALAIASRAGRGLVRYGSFTLTLRKTGFSMTGVPGRALTITSIEPQDAAPERFAEMLAAVESVARERGFSVLQVEGEDAPRIWRILADAGFARSPRSGPELRDYFKDLR